ncbi:Uncharacterised protein [Mycobacterium tuberculosis]|uniref:Uncharacterized protein n=1 Tax=Mycobacterium tuberculosis TaxID=1773 RepID=A0A0U0U2I2_MYCTX|nr:Uncharacterised protein [Mycobacterium tuberculosis]COW70168.1 Uncharacterised protein [Mycobacterium tuberculosis]COY33047.1 Uncharacterised protein [Mycobacterium tuberculosis]COY40085.1 Uncharacterised protein [Mycobacterium tuberculosis]
MRGRLLGDITVPRYDAVFLLATRVNVTTRFRRVTSWISLSRPAASVREVPRPGEI